MKTIAIKTLVILSIVITVCSLVVGFKMFQSVGGSIGRDLISDHEYELEQQPDCPILLRDLTITNRPEESNRLKGQKLLNVSFYVENRSGKRIKYYGWQDCFKKKVECNLGGFGTDLAPGESRQIVLAISPEEEPKIYRVIQIRFDDGAGWKAKPFVPRKD